MNVMFECKDFPGPDHLGSSTIERIINKDIVKDFLKNMEFIPHIRTTISMEPTTTIKL